MSYTGALKGENMHFLSRLKEKMGPLGEWLSIMGPLLAMFIFVHHENVHLTDRLDTHIIEMNKRLDSHFIEINKRADILNQEFIDLLKERREK